MLANEGGASAPAVGARAIVAPASGSPLYVAGSFSSIGGATQPWVSGVDPVTGAAAAPVFALVIAVFLSVGQSFSVKFSVH